MLEIILVACINITIYIVTNQQLRLHCGHINLKFVVQYSHILIHIENYRKVHIFKNRTLQPLSLNNAV